VEKLVVGHREIQWGKCNQSIKTCLVELKGLGADSSPAFGPAHCKVCKAVLRGIMFRCKEAKCTETIPLFGIESICEECFRAQKHPWNHLAKYYKHCVLQEAISPEISRKLCRCATVERIDSNGKYISLFPVDESLEHRTSAGFQFGKCKLLQLGAIVAEAKHKEATPLSSKLGLKRKLGIRSENASIGSRTLPHLDAKMEASLDQDIPLPVRGYVAEKFPLGNAHISLMLGPLVIEIGVPQ